MEILKIQQRKIKWFNNSIKTSKHLTANPINKRLLITMKHKISEQVLTNYHEIVIDKNHRYKSWEHCYFYNEYAHKPINEDFIFTTTTMY